MADRVTVQIAVEGILDAAVLRKVLESVGLECGAVYGQKGKGELLKRLQGYNQAARHAPWVVVLDLDQAYSCAPDLIQQHLPTPAHWMRLRVAVRAIESWLLADAEMLGAFLYVPKGKFPPDPDALDNPKRALLDLVRRFSRKPHVQEALLPQEGASVGMGYNPTLIEFVHARWRPDVALHRSESLQRAIRALETLKAWKP